MPRGLGGRRDQGGDDSPEGRQTRGSKAGVGPPKEKNVEEEKKLAELQNYFNEELPPDAHRGNSGTNVDDGFYEGVEIFDGRLINRAEDHLWSDVVTDLVAWANEYDDPDDVRINGPKPEVKFIHTKRLSHLQESVSLINELGNLDKSLRTIDVCQPHEQDDDDLFGDPLDSDDVPEKRPPEIDTLKFSLVWGSGFDTDVAAIRAPKVKQALYSALWGLMLGTNGELLYGTPESIDGYNECFRVNN